MLFKAQPNISNPLSPKCLEKNERLGVLPPPPELPAIGDRAMELAALSMCNHFVIDGGHFGFWASILGRANGLDTIRIMPTNKEGKLHIKT